MLVAEAVDLEGTEAQHMAGGDAALNDVVLSISQGQGALENSGRVSGSAVIRGGVMSRAGSHLSPVASFNSSSPTHLDVNGMYHTDQGATMTFVVFDGHELRDSKTHVLANEVMVDGG